MREGRAGWQEPASRSWRKIQKAYHEYFIEEKFEAGIELSGTEVKSIRLGTLSLKEAWCQIKDGQLYIRQMHIAPYEQGNIFNKDPLRPRRLLMHKREIMRLFGKVRQDGYALVPPVGLFPRFAGQRWRSRWPRAKRLYDKRDDAAKKGCQAADRPGNERTVNHPWQIPS